MAQDSERRSVSSVSIRSRLFAATYDRMSARAEEAGLGELRRSLLARADGRVLEIGAGTGINLRHYGPGVESLTLTEPERAMLRRLEQRVNTEASATTVLRAPAEDLPFEDGSFDTAVSTLVLCGVDDQPRALRELRRVLRPGGRLLFLEHVRSDQPSVARLQDRINGLNHFLVGCECNRPTLRSIEKAGFAVGEVAHTALPKAPRFTSPAIVGVATSPDNPT
jgi:ubiquinone/menaquinone biosynthesis C-methylase UbiE